VRARPRGDRPTSGVRRGRGLRRGLWFLGPVSLVALWEIVSLFPSLPDYVLPSPEATIAALAKDAALIGSHLLATVAAALGGLAVATGAGLLVAAAMNARRPLGEVIYAQMVLSQAVPLIAVAPIVLIWFGLGVLAKLLIVAFVCFFPIAVSTYEGFRTVQMEQLDLLRTFGASRWQYYRHLFLPATLPGTFAGLKIAATYSVLGAIVGEWLGGTKGMGIYMTRALQSFRTERLFAAILAVMLTSYALFSGVRWVGNRLTPWVERREP